MIRGALIAAGILAFSGGLYVALAKPAPWIVYNHSPSMPIGFYRLTNDRATRGAIVMFQPPPKATRYAYRRWDQPPKETFLKPVAAMAGDHVCEGGGQLSINGQHAARVVSADPTGLRLPHWRGCRAMDQGELFTLTTRVSRSFDGRYYGPIHHDEIIGVYKPLWLF